jgi:chemotaxis protein methyltransferase CheR
MSELVNGGLNAYYQAQLSDAEFQKLSEFIVREYGIKLPPVKKVMLQSRLHKRLKALNMKSFAEYVDFIFSPTGQAQEVVHMIDMVSTNKTDFFREPVHFDYLLETGLKELSGNGTRKTIKIWSAGCSSGEEPYTISIVLSEFKEKNPLVDYQIIATDISTRILNSAVEAIYKEDRIANIPLQLKKKYFLKSKDRQNPRVRLVPQIRNKVKFGRLNFMDSTYPIHEKFDIIFCRNVLIYFSREDQERIINKLCANLNPAGIFFLGHSESITNLNVPLDQIKPTIFKRK